MDAILKWGPCQPQPEDLPMGKFPEDKIIRCFFQSGIRKLYMMEH